MCLQLGNATFAEKYATHAANRREAITALLWNEVQHKNPSPLRAHGRALITCECAVVLANRRSRNGSIST